MAKNFHIILVFISFFSVSLLKSQPGVFQPGDYRDGVYVKENSTNRRHIPYTHLREADVTWQKRVWRRIDLRERQNQPLYFPVDTNSSRRSLMRIIVRAILSGQLHAFKGDDFLQPYDVSEIKSKLCIQKDTIDVEEYDDQGNPRTVRKLPPADCNWLYEKFSSIDLKEDWFFDKQKSSLDVRIIGMTFNTEEMDDQKKALGSRENPLFTLYFPECRPVFAKNEVFNAKNDAERRTFEDIFWKRQFSSVATRESNIFDRNVESYSKGIDALLESDRIKYDIFKYEHDMWHF